MMALHVKDGVVREVPVDRGLVAMDLAIQEGYLVLFSDAGHVLAEWVIPAAKDGVYVAELYFEAAMT